MVFVYSIPDCSTRGQYIIIMKCCSQAVYKMSVAASLTKPNPLTAEECTNRIFLRLDKDNNGTLLSHCYLKYPKSFQPLLKSKELTCTSANYSLQKVMFILCLSVSIAIISQDEFIEGALNDEWIREMLECDPSIVKMERPLKGHAV